MFEIGTLSAALAINTGLAVNTGLANGLELASSLELMAIIAIVSSLLGALPTETLSAETGTLSLKIKKNTALNDDMALEVAQIPVVQIGVDALPYANFQKVSLRNQNPVLSSSLLSRTASARSWIQ